MDKLKKIEKGKVHLRSKKDYFYSFSHHPFCPYTSMNTHVHALFLSGSEIFLSLSILLICLYISQHSITT